MKGIAKIDAERPANAPGRKQACSLFDHAVELRGRQRDTFVQHGVDLEAMLKKLGKKFLASDRFLGHVLVGLIMAAEWNCVFDFVFCKHCFFVG